MVTSIKLIAYPGIVDEKHVYLKIRRSFPFKTIELMVFGPPEYDPRMVNLPYM